MPLLFLLTYIFLTYFIYKKNKDNIWNIPLIVKLNWIIWFALLFVFIVYYSWNNWYEVDYWTYIFSFYAIVILYIVTFLYHLSNYRKIIKDNKNEITITVSTKWIIEKYIDSFYFISIIFLSFFYFLFSLQRIDNSFIYLIILLSSIYIIFEKNILSVDTK